MPNPLKPRSAEITDGADRVAHRALLFADGLTRADLSKPLVAIVNSWNEIVPGCIHLPRLAAPWPRVSVTPAACRWSSTPSPCATAWPRATSA